MATYRYIVTVELARGSVLTSEDIANEIDSNLEYDMLNGELEDFKVEPLSATFGQRLYPGQGFVTAPNSPDGRYDD
jgi:hypothetical protein